MKRSDPKLGSMNLQSFNQILDCSSCWVCPTGKSNDEQKDDEKKKIESSAQIERSWPSGKCPDFKTLERGKNDAF